MYMYTHTTGEDNSHHYFVASQDPELRGRLRGLPGVPLLHIIINTMVLEKPSESTQDRAQQVRNL
jgi:U3 small nucleolar RNA-associated protein 23